MKFDEIKVGEAYYHTSSRDWQNLSDGTRVVVVESGRWAYRQFGPDSTPYQVSTGGGVLVDKYRGDRPEPYQRRAVVLPQHIRGPWVETRELVTAKTTERHALREIEREQRRAREQRIDAAREVLVKLGISPVAESRSWDVATITLDIADVERLVGCAVRLNAVQPGAFKLILDGGGSDAPGS